MIRWFAQNGVAANLLAAIILIAGLFTVSNIKLELFPQLDPDTVNIRVPYPGAAPKEVESSVIELIEDRIQNIDGIKKITGKASEGQGSVLVEVQRGYDATEVADKIKVRVDAINNFPEEAEEPTVEEILIRNEVISIAIYGNTDVKALKELAEYVRDELNVRQNISQVDIRGVAEFEISVNVSEISLRRYGLTFDQVVQAIRNTSVDIPGGSIKSRGVEILLRTTGKAYTASEFASIPIITNSDGGVVYLEDVATIDDGFVDDPLITEFNGERAVLLRIFALGNENALDVAARVQDFAEDINRDLPAGIHAEVFRDLTFYLKGRLQMLLKNGAYGLILVMLILTLFLRPSLAFFVMLGIPISFLGATLFLPALDISINLSSLFGFILALGIVVDDAIIVGESVFSQYQKQGGSSVEASISGTKRVSIPVTFAVLTTIVAFLPILTIPGFLGKFFYPIPVVVIAALLWSLIESKLVLPYHLTLCKVGHGQSRNTINRLQRLQRKVASGLEYSIDRAYRPFLKKAIEFRYTTVSLFIATLMIMVGMLVGKHLPFVFFPTVPSDYIVAKLVMPEGTPSELTLRAIQQMQTGLEKLIQQTEAAGHGNPFQNSVVTIGEQPFGGSGGPMGKADQSRGIHLAEIAVELLKREDLTSGGKVEMLSAPNLAKQWRQLIGPIAGVKELSFNANAAGNVGAPIDIQLSGRNFKELHATAEAIKAKLATYEGLFDVKDSYSSGKREIQLDILPESTPLGLRQADLGRQVRAAFYGVEAQRIQRGPDDIRVMVRYPLDERRSIENLKDLRIRTPDGKAVPFAEVGELKITDGFSTITRVNRRRVINITADADKNIADLEVIKRDLQGQELPAGWIGKILSLTGFEEKTGAIEAIVSRNRGIAWSFEGEAREQADIFTELKRMTLIALCIIYALLAVPLKSYSQPLIVMIVIPFGLIGAIIGHILMAQPMSILSILGFVALSGVVLNDSLVLVDFINQERNQGKPLRQAIQDAGSLRFRPIILTSLTTFAGLLSILFESSLQAQFLIPMAISLSFGVLFATFITLLLVPAFYSIFEDVRELIVRLILQKPKKLPPKH